MPARDARGLQQHAAVDFDGDGVFDIGASRG